jgi:hypothetical protein
MKFFAGRELDALVAKQVMGLTVRGTYVEDRLGSTSSLPFFSTDIAAAWQIAETFIQAGAAAWIEGDGHTGYRAGCTYGAGLRAEAAGDSPAHAMCLAALHALGV